MTPKKSKGIFTYILIVLLSVFCLYFVISKLSSGSASTEYTSVISYFDNYEVSYYELDLGSGELTYQLRGSLDKHKYNVPNVNIFLSDTEDYRKEYNEKYPDEPLVQNYIKITDRTWIYSLIPVVLTVALGIFILYFMMKQSGGGGKYNS
ncbi:MAG: ATP-dependent zinc metalloprotease FtsH, partial [Ruminococcus sp.]|nr:ATP-dependent zinc metalloprotease FtsH [Ruminococcus sp.]